MSAELPIIYLARHGETAWSLSGQHTGLTDLPLTAAGERTAGRLGARLAGLTFEKVFTSPLQRAKRTCELAGFGTVAEVDPDLVEWNYGEYEGLTGAEIRARRSGWQLFRDGCPGGDACLATPPSQRLADPARAGPCRAPHGDAPDGPPSRPAGSEASWRRRSRSCAGAVRAGAESAA